MKATIKLIESYKPTQKGYPIYLELVHNKMRKREIIGHSEKEFWNHIISEPFKEHPNYNVLYLKVQEYKSKIKYLEFRNYTFQEASTLLFTKVHFKSIIFYDAALAYAGGNKNGKLYKTVLNSFNAFYPNIEVKEITPWHAKNYMKGLLMTNKPNGVHTYMRTLNALYNKLNSGNNPFKSIRPKKVKTPNKALNDQDLKKLIYTRTILNKFDGKNTYDSINYPRYYWLLMFYLGGIDFVDLASLRYDKHIVNDRIQFNRNKGGTNVFINNKILPEAKEILSKFNSWPYLVPAFKYKDYNSYVRRINNRLKAYTVDLNLSKKPLTKSARYTFITRAQQLLVDERITMEIVGHAQQKTHSIYLDEFPLEVRDATHKKIITI